MRIRTIKPEFWRSDDIDAIDWDTRLVFVGLWSYVDDNGVGVDKLASICADLFAGDLERDPSDTFARVSRGLQSLSERGLISRYTVEGKAYLHVTNWSTHQRIDRPNNPRHPLPTSENAAIRDTLATPSRDSRESPVPGAVEQGISGSVEEETCSPAAPTNGAIPLAPSSKAGKKLASKPGDPSGFAEFWSIYPRRVARGDAVKAFVRAIKKAELAEILEGARRYAADPNRIRKDITYTAHAASWLNAERWTDEQNPGRNGNAGGELWQD